MQFVLLDRALLYLERLMTWSHARRDTDAFVKSLSPQEGLTRDWTDAERSVLQRWIKTHVQPGHRKAESTSLAFRALLEEKLRN